jgi:uncharacterized membrane protein
MNIPWHLYLMAFVYILAGLNHFRKPRLYLKIIPSYFPNPKLLNYLSGLLEIILGILLCIPTYSKYAAWGLISLLVLFLPIHLYMLTNEKAAMGLPKWVLILRIPFQFILIYWAYQYAFYCN